MSILTYSHFISTSLHNVVKELLFFFIGKELLSLWIHCFLLLFISFTSVGKKWLDDDLVHWFSLEIFLVVIVWHHHDDV